MPLRNYKPLLNDGETLYMNFCNGGEEGVSEMREPIGNRQDFPQRLQYGYSGCCFCTATVLELCVTRTGKELHPAHPCYDHVYFRLTKANCMLSTPVCIATTCCTYLLFCTFTSGQSNNTLLSILAYHLFLGTLPRIENYHNYEAQGKLTELVTKILYNDVIINILN
jgi:hypothetical protein